jgi:hypothetical protein
MGKFEIVTMQAVQSIDSKMRDQNEIDWEQRRYEIAKELYTNKCLDVVAERAAMGMEMDGVEQLEAKLAVKWADALVEELKNPTSDD